MYIYHAHTAYDVYTKSNNTITQKPVSDIEIYSAYFSLYILFPTLYNVLVSGNQSLIVVLWRYITSGVFDAVRNIKEFLTDLFYGILRTFGLYNFSTYTIVKNGREIYTASSMFFYYKSDEKSVYRIDRAKYNVCKWIDKQCQLYRINHHEEPEINETNNEIYDFIIHKVDNNPYTRIHRGDFNGRTHTLITQHYRPFPKSYQMAEKAELTVYTNSTSVEPPLQSSETGGDSNTEIYECFQPQTFTINLKTPNNFFLEKNEILDSKFLQWKLYNEFGKSDLAIRLRSPFYNYNVTMFYTECMKNYFTEEATSFPAYKLNEQQSVIIGHTYIVKVDSILRCPIFDSGEKQVFDIDGVLSNYYDCSDSDVSSISDSETETDTETETETDTETETETETASEKEKEKETDQHIELNTQSVVSDDLEFEIIQETS
jgi:hypothetical protein